MNSFQGFSPDPVKKWKEVQKKKELEESGEVEVDEEDEEKEEEEEDKKGGEEKKTDKKLSDYDYLVGMAMIKLSEEEKNKLVRESEAKLKELKILQSKKWSDLWEDDIKVVILS